MRQTIDIEILKKKPDIFFSQLSEEAEKEFTSLFEYFVYKYQLKVDIENNDEKKKVGGILKNFSNPSLIDKENNIWEQIIKRKYENH